jgi:hypothetical protein
MRFELTTPTLARLCSTPELRPRHRNCRLHDEGVMHQWAGFDKMLFPALRFYRLCPIYRQILPYI